MHPFADSYGTKPHLLPRWMARVIAKDGSPAWTGRDGFRLVDLAEHLEYERVGIGRFPRETHGPVDWGQVDPALVLDQQDADLVDLPALGRFMPRSVGIVVMWVSLEIPSVWTQPGLLEGPVAVTNGFWIFSPADQVLVESYSGTVTAARVFQH